MPCLMFFWKNPSSIHLERTSHILANMICPVLLETIIKGDTRISLANIIWINPDTTTWIRNARKYQRGEIALEIVVEKSAVKQSGDAWRIVLDACLPVLHLIDTRRSIPYGIKQVQELLGVASGFDQAIQRLSTSVTMVAKGITKEHLILLANSMTCTGNLVGFNSGGIKALYNSLNVQVPFTEATLFTPRKCFEKAAEKCHMDALSNIVASCSWGKHVAVGTGSRFDILWDKKEVELNVEGGIDVYNFLNMVRSVSNGGEPDTGCLGFEIDDVVLEEEYAEWSLSPEHNLGTDKPVFEDSAEYTFDNQMLGEGKAGGSSWEKVSPGLDGGGEWGGEKFGNVGASTANPNWSSWGSKNKTQDVSTTKVEGDWGPEKFGNAERNGEKAQHGNWGADKLGNMGTSGAQSDSWSGWGVNKSLKHDASSEKGLDCSFKSNGWGAQESHKGDSLNTWGRTGVDDDGKALDQGRESSIWDHANQEKGTMSNFGSEAGSWGKQKDAPESTWGKKKGLQESTWGKQKDPQESTWGKQKEPQESTWGKKKDLQESTWGKQKDPQESTWGKQGDVQESTWGKQGDVQGSTWGKQKEPQESSWGKKKDSQESSWGMQKDSQETPWGKQKDSEESSRGWGSPYESNQPSVRGWDSSNSGGGIGSEKQYHWGRQNRDWKDKNRPAKSPGMANNDSAAGGIFTATRQRLDMFTSEEQDILLDVEPIMQSIRRIMHQSGYNDGDPLSAEDQSYIQDNVFNHHPDKAVKMGAGIDHFMVTRHSSFQESRCLYVVDTNGRREDFSYRKCLDNYIKSKYPELAEAFLGKYFRKPRPGGNRERTPGAPGTPGTPGAPGTPGVEGSSGGTQELQNQGGETRNENVQW